MGKRAERVVILADRLPFLPPLFAGLMRLHHSSCHFTILGQEYENAALQSGRPLIYTAWHFAFPAVIYHLRDRNGMVMVSRSRDGECVARILKNLGYESARGSPGKGGGTALRSLISHFKKGYPGGFIADGSQGPARVAQKGILALARHTRSPLVPMSMAASPCWRFRSWDRTVLAKPFSRIVLSFGRPMWISQDTTEEQLEVLRGELGQSLDQLTLESERALEQH